MIRSKECGIIVLCAIVFSIFVSAAMAAEKPKSPAPQAIVPKPANQAAASPVQKKNVIVEVKRVIAVVGELKPINVTVRSADGAPVRQGEVKLSINGAPLKYFAGFSLASGVTEGTSILTDDNGVAAYSIAPRPDNDKTVHMGANTIEAEFTGNTATGGNVYRSGNATATLSILKGQTKILINSNSSGCLTSAFDYQSMWGKCFGLPDRTLIITREGKDTGMHKTIADGTFAWGFIDDFTGKPYNKSTCKIVFQGDAFFLPTTFDAPCN